MATAYTSPQHSGDNENLIDDIGDVMGDDERGIKERQRAQVESATANSRQSNAIGHKQSIIDHQQHRRSTIDGLNYKPITDFRIVNINSDIFRSRHNIAATVVNSTPRGDEAWGTRPEIQQTGNGCHLTFVVDGRPSSTCSDGGRLETRTENGAVVAYTGSGSGLDRPDSGLSCVSSELDSGFDDLRSFVVTPAPLFPVAALIEEPDTDGDNRILMTTEIDDRVSVADGTVDFDEDEQKGTTDRQTEDEQPTNHNDRSSDSSDVSVNSDLYRSQDLTGMTDASLTDGTFSSPDRGAVDDERADVAVEQRLDRKTTLSSLPPISGCNDNEIALQEEISRAESRDNIDDEREYDVEEQSLFIDMTAGNGDVNGVRLRKVVAERAAMSSKLSSPVSIDHQEHSTVMGNTEQFKTCEHPKSSSYSLAKSAIQAGDGQRMPRLVMSLRRVPGGSFGTASDFEVCPSSSPLLTSAVPLSPNTADQYRASPDIVEESTMSVSDAFDSTALKSSAAVKRAETLSVMHLETSPTTVAVTTSVSENRSNRTPGNPGDYNVVADRHGSTHRRMHLKPAAKKPRQDSPHPIHILPNPTLSVPAAAVTPAAAADDVELPTIESKNLDAIRNMGQLLFDGADTAAVFGSDSKSAERITATGRESSGRDDTTSNSILGFNRGFNSFVWRPPFHWLHNWPSTTPTFDRLPMEQPNYASLKQCLYDVTTRSVASAVPTSDMTLQDTAMDLTMRRQADFWRETSSDHFSPATTTISDPICGVSHPLGCVAGVISSGGSVLPLNLMQNRIQRSDELAPIPSRSDINMSANQINLDGFGGDTSDRPCSRNFVATTTAVVSLDRSTNNNNNNNVAFPVLEESLPVENCCRSNRVDDCDVTSPSLIQHHPIDDDNIRTTDFVGGRRSLPECDVTTKTRRLPVVPEMQTPSTPAPMMSAAQSVDAADRNKDVGTDRNWVSKCIQLHRARRAAESAVTENSSFQNKDLIRPRASVTPSAVTLTPRVYEAERRNSVDVMYNPSTKNSILVDDTFELMTPTTVIPANSKHCNAYPHPTHPNSISVRTRKQPQQQLHQTVSQLQQHKSPHLLHTSHEDAISKNMSEQQQQQQQPMFGVLRPFPLYDVQLQEHLRQYVMTGMLPSPDVTPARHLDLPPPSFSSFPSSSSSTMTQPWNPLCFSAPVRLPSSTDAHLSLTQRGDHQPLQQPLMRSMPAALLCQLPVGGLSGSGVGVWSSTRQIIHDKSSCDPTAGRQEFFVPPSASSTSTVSNPPHHRHKATPIPRDGIFYRPYQPMPMMQTFPLPPQQLNFPVAGRSYQPQSDHTWMSPLLLDQAQRQSSGSVGLKDLRPESIRVLQDWVDRNASRPPYPTSDEKLVMAERAGITTKQVCKWFEMHRKKLKEKQTLFRHVELKYTNTTNDSSQY